MTDTKQKLLISQRCKCKPNNQPKLR